MVDAKHTATPWKTVPVELPELPELPKGYLVMMSPDPEAMPVEWFDAADMQAYAHQAVASATAKLNALIGMQHTQLVAAEQRLAAAPQQGPMCSRCGSTTVIGCNHMGCFAMEAGEDADLPTSARPMTEADALAIWRQVAPGCDGLKVSRDVGPYEVTELTPLALRLFRAIEAHHGIKEQS